MVRLAQIGISQKGEQPVRRGNMTRYGDSNYGYDWANRFIGCDGDNCEYDALNRRVTKVEVVIADDDKVMWFVYDGSRVAEQLRRTLHVTLGSDIYVAMKTTMQSFDVRTPSRDAMIDITSKVQAVVSEAGVGDGVAAVYVLHTTAGVTINENADPDVIHDVLAASSSGLTYSGAYRVQR